MKREKIRQNSYDNDFLKHIDKEGQFIENDLEVKEILVKNDSYEGLYLSKLLNTSSELLESWPQNHSNINSKILDLDLKDDIYKKTN